MESPLDLHSKGQSVVRSREEGEESIAGYIGHLAIVIGDQGLEEADGLGGLDRVPGLVALKTVAVPDHVGKHNGREAATWLSSSRALLTFHSRPRHDLTARSTS